MRPGSCDALGVNVYHRISAASAQEVWDGSRGSLFSSHWSHWAVYVTVSISPGSMSVCRAHTSASLGSPASYAGCG